MKSSKNVRRLEKIKPKTLAFQKGDTFGRKRYSRKRLKNNGSGVNDFNINDKRKDNASTRSSYFLEKAKQGVKFAAKVALVASVGIASVIAVNDMRNSFERRNNKKVILILSTDNPPILDKKYVQYIFYDYNKISTYFNILIQNDYSIYVYDYEGKKMKKMANQYDFEEEVFLNVNHDLSLIFFVEENTEEKKNNNVLLEEMITLLKNKWGEGRQDIEKLVFTKDLRNLDKKITNIIKNYHPDKCKKIEQNCNDITVDLNNIKDLIKKEIKNTKTQHHD